MANDRARAAETCGMDRQTLRGEEGQETVRGTVFPTNGHRYNAEGLAGLSDRWKGVRVARLAPAQMADLGAWVEAGPDLEKDGVVRWRRQDLQRRIAEAFGVEVHERTVGKYLAALGYRRLQVAPAAPENRPGRARGVQKNFRAAVAAVIPETAQGRPLEIWFQDEARVGQQGTLTRIWARRGTRPRAPRDTRYQWAYLFGAICPARAVAAGLVLPVVSTAAMNAHLAEISRHASLPVPMPSCVGKMIPRIIF